MGEFESKPTEENPLDEVTRYTKPVIEMLTGQEKIAGSLDFGPTYVTETSAREMVFGTVVTRTYPFSLENPSKRYKQVVIIATDRSGNVIGHRRTDLSNDEGKVTAKGSILVLERGKGYSTALELMHTDYLSQEADAKGQEVEYRITAGNPADLSRLKRSALENPSSISKKTIQEKEEENERWKTLYAQDGALGAGLSGKVIFEPNEESVAVPPLSQVHIFREDKTVAERKRLSASRLAIQESKDPIVARKDAEKNLMQNIFPQLQALLK